MDKNIFFWVILFYFCFIINGFQLLFSELTSLPTLKFDLPAFGLLQESTVEIVHWVGIQWHGYFFRKDNNILLNFGCTQCGEDMNIVYGLNLTCEENVMIHELNFTGVSISGGQFRVEYVNIQNFNQTCSKVHAEIYNLNLYHDFHNYTEDIQHKYFKATKFNELLGIYLNPHSREIEFIRAECEDSENEDNCNFWMEDVWTLYEFFTKCGMVDISFSLDPAIPSNPTSVFFKTVFYPQCGEELLRNSHLGQTLLDSDLYLKHSLHNQSLRNIIDEYKTIDELNDNPQSSYTRLWLSFGDIKLPVSNDGQTLMFENTSIPIVFNAANLRKSSTSNTYEDSGTLLLPHYQKWIDMMNRNSFFLSTNQTDLIKLVQIGRLIYGVKWAMERGYLINQDLKELIKALPVIDFYPAEINHHDFVNESFYFTSNTEEINNGIKLISLQINNGESLDMMPYNQTKSKTRTLDCISDVPRFCMNLFEEEEESMSENYINVSCRIRPGSGGGSNKKSKVEKAPHRDICSDAVTLLNYEGDSNITLRTIDLEPLGFQYYDLIGPVEILASAQICSPFYGSVVRGKIVIILDKGECHPLEMILKLQQEKASAVLLIKLDKTRSYKTIIEQTKKSLIQRIKIPLRLTAEQLLENEIIQFLKTHEIEVWAQFTCGVTKIEEEEEEEKKNNKPQFAEYNLIHQKLELKITMMHDSNLILGEGLCYYNYITHGGVDTKADSVKIVGSHGADFLSNEIKNNIKNGQTSFTVKGMNGKEYDVRYNSWLNTAHVSETLSSWLTKDRAMDILSFVNPFSKISKAWNYGRRAFNFANTFARSKFGSKGPSSFNPSSNTPSFNPSSNSPSFKPSSKPVIDLNTKREHWQRGKKGHDLSDKEVADVVRNVKPYRDKIQNGRRNRCYSTGEKGIEVRTSEKDGIETVGTAFRKNS